MSASAQQGRRSSFPDLPFAPVQAAQHGPDPEAHGLREAPGRPGPGGEPVPGAEALPGALRAPARADQQAPRGQRQRDAAAVSGSECFGDDLLLERRVAASLGGGASVVLMCRAACGFCCCVFT